MNELISPEDLVSAMIEAAETYTNEIRETVEEGVERIAGETLKEVRDLSPVYKGDHVRNVKKFGEKATSGAYRRRWTCDIDRSRGKIRIIVHNRQFSLVHLLELGHLNRDGTTRSKAFPHVEISEKHAEEKINKLLEDL